jgi:hypothetical protein
MQTAKNLFLALVALGWLAILTLVGGRFLALLADANRESEIIQRLYRHSDFWVKPFYGMFDWENEVVNSTGGVFEPASLVAFIVYFVGGIALFALFEAVTNGDLYFRRTHADRHVDHHA